MKDFIEQMISMMHVVKLRLSGKSEVKVALHLWCYSTGFYSSFEQNLPETPKESPKMLVMPAFKIVPDNQDYSNAVKEYVYSFLAILEL